MKYYIWYITNFYLIIIKIKIYYFHIKEKKLMIKNIFFYIKNHNEFNKINI